MILATWEAEIGRIKVGGQLGQVVYEQKKKVRKALSI
jgi:hypothetical protein